MSASRTHRVVIGVMGAAVCNDDIAALARMLGRPVILLRSWELDADLPRATTADDALRLAFAGIEPDAAGR